jgi:endonuclease/exonuclease/phosphatase family metal-dependent hydrolase
MPWAPAALAVRGGWPRAGPSGARTRHVLIPQIARRALLVVLWPIAAACVPQRPALTPSGPVVLAVITWNMNAGRGDLPRLLDDLASSELTGAAAPDQLVLLQEAGEDGTAGFGRERRLSAFFGAVRRSADRTSGNAILSTQPLREARAIDLPRERQPRAAAIATVAIAGETLFVVSTHLENRLSVLRGGLFSDGARGRQAAALLAALPPDAHGIAGGDLNTMLGPSEPAWRAFLARFPDTPRERARPTFRNRLVLDHLFFDIPEAWVATTRVLPDRYGSDHQPVLGLVRIADP